MSYFLRFFLSLLLIPVFLLLVLIAIPVLMLITCVTARITRNVRVKTFTAVWPPEQPADRQSPFSGDEPVYDVDCTVISSAPLEENRESSNHGKLSSQAPDAPPSIRKGRNIPGEDLI